MKTKLFTLLALTLLSTLNPQLSTCFAQGTAFTYQGRLTDNGSPAEGIFNLRFTIYDSATNGSAVSGVLTNAATGVSNGLFNVTLDFGAGVFTGADRWLDIGVRTNGSAGDYQTLSPRQPLTPTPYALYAVLAGTVPPGAIDHSRLATNSVTTLHLQPGAVTADRIAAGQVVKTLNGLTDNVLLAAGANLTLRTNGNALEMSATPPCFASVKDFGAVGDGATNDTAALQAALNSGAASICFPKGRYLTDALTVPGTVRRIFGDGELVQRTVFASVYPLFGGGLLNIVGVTNLTIEGPQFTGLPNFIDASGNSALFVLSCEQMIVRNCRFTGWRTHAVYAQNSSDVLVAENLVYGVAGGLRFTGVRRGVIAQNIVRDTQLAPTNFTVAIGLDSTDGHSYGICRDIVIANNHVKTYVNAQAILIHAGQRIAVVGNVLEDVLIGISTSPFHTNDTLRDVTIAANVYHGTSTPGSALDNGNYGIAAGGGADFRPEHIVITGNVINNANAVVRHSAQGGIGIGYADDVLIADNLIRHSVGAGIVQFYANTSVVIRNNSISDIVALSEAGGTRAGIYLVGEGTKTGRISGNRIDGVAWGIRADVPAPGVRIGENDYFNYQDKIVNSTNLSFERGRVTIAGTNVAATVIFGAPEPDTDYYVAATVTVTSGTPAVGATRAYLTDKTTNSFTLNLEAAPGDGSSVTVDWHLRR